jgi:hypothetical protein
MHDDRRARLVLPMAIAALALWPLSYAWIPSAGRNPDWIVVLVPLAEIAAILVAIAAIWLGVLVTRDGVNTPSSDRGGRLGMVVVILVVGGNLIGQALFR